MKRYLPHFGVLVALGLAIVVWGASPNRTITVTSFDLAYATFPEAMDGLTLVQVSDLHNQSFGENQQELVDLILAQEPDLVAFTGDMVDSWTADYDQALVLIRELAKHVPVVIVDGNHDAREPDYPLQKAAMEDAGGIVLADESLAFGWINLIGLKERFGVNHRAEPIAHLVQEDRFNLLLAHHPADFDDYASVDVDLVLTGHVHGGQFRFFGVGLVSPDEGLFPRYHAGKHTQLNTTMIVSRGLGESILPLRLFNGPELVVIRLAHQP
jgi:predicted MPP superfamily phosphohydrolase